MKTRLLFTLFSVGALLAFAPIAHGQPTFVQTPPGSRVSLWTYPDSWDPVHFTVTAMKSDGQGISSWDLNPIPDGVSLTVTPSGAGPYDEVTWDFSWTPTHDHQGSVVLSFTATDGNGTGAHQVTLYVKLKDLPTGGTDYYALYRELEDSLDNFQDYLDSIDPAVEQVQPPAPLMLGTTVQGASSLQADQFLSWNGDGYEPDPDYLAQMKDQIDRIAELGVDVIKMNLGFPLFTDAFHDWCSATVTDWDYAEIGCDDIHVSPGRWGSPSSGATGDPEVWEHGVDVPWSKEDFILFYKELADYIRNKGKKVYMTHNTIKWQFTNINSLGYFDQMKAEEGWVHDDIRVRYRHERASEFAFVCKELQPDYALVIMEAGHQNKDFGDLDPPGGHLEAAPLFSNRYWPSDSPYYELGWGVYVDDAIAAFKAIPGGPPQTDLGVCIGTWDQEEAAYSLITEYARHEDIDYIDLHMFIARATQNEGSPDEIIIDCLKNLITWTNHIRAINSDARILIGECWLFKAHAKDYGEDPPLPLPQGAGRDNYSFWAPMDQQYLRLMGEACKRKNLELLIPFYGPNFFYDYLSYVELPTDYGAPDWNPPIGYDLQDIDTECAGIAILYYYKNPPDSTWWSDPETGRLAEGRLTLTGEVFKTLNLVEICDNTIDDDFDGLVDDDDPDCILKFILELDASYEAGILNLDFTLGTPGPAIWESHLILTDPAIEIITLWTIPLLLIDPPMTVPMSFPLASQGIIGIWSAYRTQGGPQAVELVWIDTGT